MRIRKLFFWAHLVAGSAAGIVILVMALTGILLAFERQVNAWSDSSIRIAAPPIGASPQPLEELIPQDKGAVPTVTLRSRPLAPIELLYSRERTVLINPFTAQSMGEMPPGTRRVFTVVEKLHRSLGGALRNSVGRSVVGISNLIFLFLVGSGLYLWFPRRWSWKYVRPALWFRGGLEGRARNWNRHNAIGFWCSVPLFFIAISGVVMSYGWANNLLYRMTGTEPPATRPGELVRKNPAANSPELPGLSHARSLAELISTVERQNPKWQTISFQMPRPQDRLIVFSIDEGTGGQPQKRWQKTLDRTTAATVRLDDFDHLNAGRKLRTIARFLHTGEIFGLPGQLLAAVASSGAVLLVWTGLALVLRRIRKQVSGWRTRERRPSTMQTPAETLSSR